MACYLLFLGLDVQSQILKKLTEKIEAKAQSEKATPEKEKDEGGKLEGLFSGEGGMDFSAMMGGTKDFNPPSEYSFDFQVTMEMNLDKGKSMNQVWKYNLAESYFGMETNGMLIIYDLDSDMMVTLNPKDQTYTAMSTSMMGMMGKAADADADELPEMVKTSETKTILGYKATKYLMEDEDMRGEFWMAPDVKFDQAAFAKSLGSYSKNQAPLPEKMQGFMMEMTAFDKKGKVTSHMKVVQLGEINQEIDMSKYKNGMAF